MLDYLFTKTPLTFLVQSLWRDEAFSVLLARKNIFQILWVSLHDFSPPLYFLLLHIWVKIFGPGEIALRSLSLVFFLAMIYMVFLFIKDILKIRERSALFYSLLFLINPLFVYYAFEARMYAMMGFLAVGSFYFFCRRQVKPFFWITLLSLFTHYFMVFIPLSQAAYLYFFEKHQHETAHYFRLIRNIFILFLPWLALFLLFNLFGGTNEFWITKKPEFLNLPAFMFVGFDENMSYLKQFLFPLSIFLYAVLAIGIARLPRFEHEEKKRFLLLALWVVVPTVSIFLLSFVKPLFLGRYLIGASAGFLLLLIAIIDRLPTFAKILIFIVLIFFSVGLNNNQIKQRKKANLRAFFTQIKALLRDDDVVYVTSELNFHEAQYYIDEKKVYIYAKNYRNIPSYVGKALIPKDHVKTMLPIFPKKAIVIESDLSYQILSMY